MTINYYDDYVFNVSGAPTSISVFGVSSTSNTKGLLTGSKSRIIDTGNWVTTVTLYDDYKRQIYSYINNNLMSTTNIVESRLDELQGWVFETKSTHKKTGKADIITYDYFEDDSQYARNGSEDFRLRLEQLQEFSCDKSIDKPRGLPLSR